MQLYVTNNFKLYFISTEIFSGANMVQHKRLFLLISILPIIILPFLVNMSNNNACTSYWDYILINFSKNCYYDPDSFMTVPELVKKYTGQDCKTYNLTTSDGYLLTMFRIYHKNPIGVVLLQPSVIGGAYMWLINGTQSFAFLLWRMGYDVWLPNQRGSEHSRTHVNYTVEDDEFWNFGIHEIAIYDFEVQLDVIHEETGGSQIFYLGYSKSGAEALIYASLKPREAEKYIKAFILVVPVAVIDHFVSLIGKALFYTNWFFNINTGESKILEPFRWSMEHITFAPHLINLMHAMIFGTKYSETDPVTIPFVAVRGGKGISNKLIHHYSQIFRSKKHFPMYDYGIEENRIKYGSDEPLEYPLEKITVPIQLIHGGIDSFLTPIDMDLLSNHLLPQGLAQKIFVPGANHVDFLLDGYYNNVMVNHVLAIFDKYTIEDSSGAN